MAPRAPTLRRSPIRASSGTSNTFRAPTPPMSRMNIRGWSPSASIRNVTSAPNTCPYHSAKRSRSGVSVATWLKPLVMGIGPSLSSEGRG